MPMKKMQRLAVKLLAIACLGSWAAGTSAAPTCSVRGVVTRSSGQPAPSLWVVLSQGSQERAKSLTTDNGKYYVARLDPGTYSLAVRRSGATLAALQVSVAGDEIRNIAVP